MTIKYGTKERSYNVIRNLTISNQEIYSILIERLSSGSDVIRVETEIMLDELDRFRERHNGNKS